MFILRRGRGKCCVRPPNLSDPRVNSLGALPTGSGLFLSLHTSIASMHQCIHICIRAFPRCHRTPIVLGAYHTCVTYKSSGSHRPPSSSPDLRIFERSLSKLRHIKIPMIFLAFATICTPIAAWILWSWYSLFLNYRIARRTGLPCRVIPISHENHFGWLLTRRYSFPSLKESRLVQERSPGTIGEDGNSWTSTDPTKNSAISSCSSHRGETGCISATQLP